MSACRAHRPQGVARGPDAANEQGEAVMKKSASKSKGSARKASKGKTRVTKANVEALPEEPVVEALVEGTVPGTEPTVEVKQSEPVTPKPRSCLDAAAQVLKDKGEPMRCKDMIAAMLEQRLWHSNAPTPHATLYSAILREIGTKGGESRFKKTERGHFALNA